MATTRRLGGIMTKRPFRFGISGRGETLQQWRDFARKAEDLGYASLDLPDHFAHQFAPLIALGVAAQATSTIRFATTMMCNDFRHPVMLAKEAATLDVLSDGRFELGLGTGSQPRDNVMSGIPEDPPGKKVERLTETIDILKAHFSDAERIDYPGKHYQISDLEAYPKPVQKPLPIMLGARGDRMLRLAAREADIIGVMANDSGPDLAAKMSVVRESAGDRYAQIEFTQLYFNVQVDGQPSEGVAAQPRQPNLVGSRDQIVEQLQKLREDHNVSYIMVIGPVIEIFAPVVAQLSGE
jgi:probable F420-dependent oxidoreductase